VFGCRVSDLGLEERKTGAAQVLDIRQGEGTRQITGLVPVNIYPIIKKPTFRLVNQLGHPYITHPLDVGVFSSFKYQHQKVLQEYVQGGNNTFTRIDFLWGLKVYCLSELLDYVLEATMPPPPVVRTTLQHLFALLFHRRAYLFSNISLASNALYCSLE
jgi:hypothetical protein